MNDNLQTDPDDYLPRKDEVGPTIDLLATQLDVPWVLESMMHTALGSQARVMRIGDADYAVGCYAIAFEPGDIDPHWQDGQPLGPQHDFANDVANYAVSRLRKPAA